MIHLKDAIFKDLLPARAQRLYEKTFNKYHKLDGGDEEVALLMARQAVEREYVKLNDQWFSKKAAEEIVRHDIAEDSLSETEETETVTAPKIKLNYKKNTETETDTDDDDDDDNDTDTENDNDTDDDDDDTDDHVKGNQKRYSRKRVYFNQK